MNELKITSPIFKEGEWMPNSCSGYGEDISPELHIDGVDEKAVSLMITLDDLGHPISPGYNHWVAWNLPPVAVIPEALPHGAIVNTPIHLEQGLAYGKHCYRGPKPPFNWNHAYRFTVYVLDTILDINTDSDKEAVLSAAERHVLQTGTLLGKYQRKHK